MNQCVNNIKTVFGSGTKLIIMTKDVYEPSYFELTDDDEPETKVCLATGFSRYNVTGEHDIFNKTFNEQPPVRISDDSLFNQVAFLSDTEKCGGTEEPGPCTDGLKPDPQVNFVTVTILGLRLLFIKTVVFNVLLTLRLWISRSEPDRKQQTTLAANQLLHKVHTHVQHLGLRTQMMWLLAAIELHENACVTDEGGGGFCLKACWDRIFTANRKRRSSMCTRFRKKETRLQQVEVRSDSNIRQQQRRRNNATSEYFQHVVEKNNNLQLIHLYLNCHFLLHKQKNQVENYKNKHRSFLKKKLLF
ncbi:hypothetical protein Q5P01_022973 [Channa striata]|uniref:Uncharacterized protein n=1 Tax=Channa striata TaxID=64152 RepID=A0AA88RXZ4_CHASR|nr:hypothetical protein Q5P01_022973 [Channa striata]